MDKKRRERPAHLQALLAIWFFAGMPLAMALSGLYAIAGVPAPPLIFFLSGMIYLSGGFLGGLWSRESLRSSGCSGWKLVGSLIVFIVSIGFLVIGILFTVRGFQLL